MTRVCKKVNHKIPDRHFPQPSEQRFLNQHRKQCFRGNWLRLSRSARLTQVNVFSGEWLLVRVMFDTQLKTYVRVCPLANWITHADITYLIHLLLLKRCPFHKLKTNNSKLKHATQVTPFNKQSKPAYKHTKTHHPSSTLSHHKNPSIKFPTRIHNFF